MRLAGRLFRLMPVLVGAALAASCQHVTGPSLSAKIESQRLVPTSTVQNADQILLLPHPGHHHQHESHRGAHQPALDGVRQGGRAGRHGDRLSHLGRLGRHQTLRQRRHRQAVQPGRELHPERAGGRPLRRPQVGRPTRAPDREWSAGAPDGARALFVVVREGPTGRHCAHFQRSSRGTPVAIGVLRRASRSKRLVTGGKRSPAVPGGSHGRVDPWTVDGQDRRAGTEEPQVPTTS